MLLYSVYENGATRKVKKADFAQTKVYVLDESKTIYIWLGSKASKKKEDFALRKAKNLNMKRNNSAKVQMIRQNEEFGTFLAMMDDLRKGIEPESLSSERPELELEIEDTMELIEAGLEPDLIAEINLDAYNLAKENKNYEELCTELAKLQLKISKGTSKLNDKEIKKKSEEVYKSSSTYEEVCWLIAELRKLVEKDFLKPKK
ncbi:MAG: hypothetical protein ACFFD5_10695 [Candidatus Thorarchaeota archaeon]